MNDAFNTAAKRPQPQVLLAWQGNDNPGDDLRARGLAVREARLHEVHPGDFDVVVVNDLGHLIVDDPLERYQPIPEDLCVITFARGEADRLLLNGRQQKVKASPVDRGQETRYATDLSGPIQDLVQDVLVPFAKASERPRLAYTSTPPGQPIVWSSAEGTLALCYDRSQASAGVALPPDTPRKGNFIVAFIDEWADRFGRWPRIASWSSDPLAMTDEEGAIAEDLRRLGIERAAALDAFDHREAELDGRLAEVSEAADAGVRRLLTAKGADLERAVGAALRELGYKVTDMDAQKGDERRDEDFRAVDPDDLASTILVEVKGYDHGVKAMDLRKVTRHHGHAIASGVTVGATWWVVNHHRDQPPTGRPVALAGEEVSIATNAETIGLLVIDSRDLFGWLRKIAAGEATADDIRRALSGQAGRWNDERGVGEVLDDGDD